VPPEREPLRKARLGGCEIAVGDPDFLKAELGTPPLHVSRERREIGRAKAIRLNLLHNPNLKAPRLTRFLADEDATLDLGARLARTAKPGLLIFLRGELGAGKTTFARGFLRGLGYRGRVKSPTFTLVEPYEFSKLYLYHFDFYRFGEPEELRDAGLREYFAADAVCLVEWPEKALGLPLPDIEVVLDVTGAGRTAALYAETEVGKLCLDGLDP
jgi:tRNA threonylcarbamoyladenosine biosynthesis protein TsaE